MARKLLILASREPIPDRLLDTEGQRFLMIKEDNAAGENDGSSVEPRIIVVLNWFEELKERVPVN